MGLLMYLVSLTRPSHSQEGLVRYSATDCSSGCRVYTRLHSTQTTYTFGGKHPTKVVGSGTNRCIVKYQTLFFYFLRKGMARETIM